MVARGFELSMSGVRSFVDKQLCRRTVNNISELKPNEYDVIIFGSDQVWRPIYFRPFFWNMCNAFGEFATEWNHIILASYAASFGIDSLKEYTKEELKEIPSLLQRFKGVSVREDSGVELCRQLGAKAVHVLDPTMLLNKEDYVSLIDVSEKVTEKRKGIMTYILNWTEASDEVIFEMAKMTGKSVFSTLSSYGEPSKPLEQWLAGFCDADFVITDSFHACVFSIIFCKPFVVLSNSWRGNARIDSLLKMFGLEHHKLSRVSDLLPIEQYEINVNALDKKFTNFREVSFGFLKQVLDKS